MTPRIRSFAGEDASTPSPWDPPEEQEGSDAAKARAVPPEKLFRPEGFIGYFFGGTPPPLLAAPPKEATAPPLPSPCSKAPLGSVDEDERCGLCALPLPTGSQVCGHCHEAYHPECLLYLQQSSSGSPAEEPLPPPRPCCQNEELLRQARLEVEARFDGDAEATILPRTAVNSFQGSGFLFLAALLGHGSLLAFAEGHPVAASWLLAFTVFAFLLALAWLSGFLALEATATPANHRFFTRLRLGKRYLWMSRGTAWWHVARLHLLRIARSTLQGPGYQYHVALATTEGKLRPLVELPAVCPDRGDSPVGAIAARWTCLLAKLSKLPIGPMLELPAQGLWDRHLAGPAVTAVILAQMSFWIHFTYRALYL